MKKTVKKLRSRRGETLVETLAAILIAALAFSFLATAAVTATRINTRTRSTDISFHYAGTKREGRVILEEGTTSVTGSIDLYQDNGYDYYTGGRILP